MTEVTETVEYVVELTETVAGKRLQEEYRVKIQRTAPNDVAMEKTDAIWLAKEHAKEDGWKSPKSLRCYAV